MRGCERKIIMLKGTDSEIFDEAYFLLRRDFEGRGRREEEIVREAQRIVDKNTTRRRTAKFDRRALLFFLAGMAAGAAGAVIFALIF